QVVHKNPTWTLEEYVLRFDDREAIFIAKHGPCYVGYSYLVRDPEQPDRLHQSMTGIRPEWRRRGIATALKVRGATYARQKGYPMIVTRVSRTNTASLGLNARFGFRPR